MIVKHMYTSNLKYYKKNSNNEDKKVYKPQGYNALSPVYFSNKGPGKLVTSYDEEGYPIFNN